MKLARAELKMLLFTEQVLNFCNLFPQGVVNAQSLKVCPLGQWELGLVLGREGHGG